MGRHRHGLGIVPVKSSEGQLRGTQRYRRLRRVGDRDRHIARRLARQHHLVRVDILARSVGRIIINLRQRQGLRRHRHTARVVVGNRNGGTRRCQRAERALDADSLSPLVKIIIGRRQREIYSGT